MRFRFSRLAEADITEIAEHIARGDPNRASSYVRDLRVRCEQLTRFPEAAPLRPAFGESVRASVFGPYLIFYEVRGDVLEVLRVVHGARDLPSQF